MSEIHDEANNVVRIASMATAYQETSEMLDLPCDMIMTVAYAQAGGKDDYATAIGVIAMVLSRLSVDLVERFPEQAGITIDDIRKGPSPIADNWLLEQKSPAATLALIAERMFQMVVTLPDQQEAFDKAFDKEED